MSYTGPDWTHVAIGDRLHIRREFDPPHHKAGKLAIWSGRVVKDVSAHGFWLTDDDIGGCRFYSWDPGTTCHQTITPAPPR